MPKQYRAIVTFNYSRKIKHMKPGITRTLRFKGKKVRVELDLTGRHLKILEAPKQVIPDLKNAESVQIVDGTLRAVYKKPEPKPISKPQPQPQPTEPIKPVEPTPPPEPIQAKPQPLPEEKKEEAPPPPAPVKPAPKPKPVQELTEKQRDRAKLVPVPQNGIIPTPFINWNDIPEKCKVTEQAEKTGKYIDYVDYPLLEAPKGLLPELREQFKINRRYQDVLPANVWIRGPPGTGKSVVVQKFAEETGLPYWGIVGRQGIRSDELLGHWEPKGSGNFEWIEGIIPKAAKAGGILHFDEANVIDPAVLMRLDELTDNKRQLYMEETGHLIRAHPDLFIIFTTNPETFEGVKNMPDPIKSRLVKKYYLDYPPENVEKKIIQSKMRAMGAKPSEFSVVGDGVLKGTYAKDVGDFMTLVQGLREYQTRGTGEQLSYVPTTRETVGFIQDLKSGKDFFTAIETNVMGHYRADTEEYHRVEEALGGIRRK